MTEYKKLGLERCVKCKFKKMCDSCDVRTERENIVIDTINDYIAMNGYNPSVNDIAKELGVSKSNAHVALTRMANKGIIAYGDGKCNIIRVLTI